MSLPIPQWPDEATPEGVTFFGNARAVVAAWRAHGVGNPFALGMLAQAEAESSIDPGAMGDYYDATGAKLHWMKTYPPGAAPTSFGLYMRKLPRLSAIKAATGIDIHAAVLAGTNTIQSEVEAAWWELNTMAWAGKKAIEAAATAYMAAYQACALFERAGAVDAAQRRGTMAERWADYFQKRGF